MSINIAGIDIADAVINTEYRLGVLEKVIDRLIRAAPAGTITDVAVDGIRSEVMRELQKKYPSAGIEPRK